MYYGENMTTQKDSFVFYRSFFEAIKDLPDNEQLQLYKAICNLALDEVEIELDGIANTLFKLMKPNIIANTEKWKNGNKGGRPKKPVDKNKKTTGYTKEKTSGFENKKPNENVNEDVNVNDNENEDEEKNVNVDVNVNSFKKKADPFFNPLKETFTKEYNKIFNTKVYLGKQDLLKLAELADSYNDIESLIPVALNRLKNIDFKDIKFKPTANWLLKDNNFERVMNGEFEQFKDEEAVKADKTRLLELAHQTMERRKNEQR